MITPIPPIAAKPGGEKITQEPADRRPAPELPASQSSPASPVEVVTLSEIALQGAQPWMARHDSREPGAQVRTEVQAWQAAQAISDLVRGGPGRAAQAQANASAARVWNLVHD